MRLLLWLLCFIPQLVLAAGDPGSFTVGGLFTPPREDLSVKYLADIFGIVDGVLHGAGSQIVGTMFGIFNSTVLTLGSIIIMYVLLVGTLNTAHEGELLGKKWSSIWVPMRSAAGFTLILPKATGYSVIQIFVMWVVVQGVGAADTIWSSAMNYLLRGGVLVQSISSSDSATEGGPTNKPATQLVAGNVFKLETCMALIENALNDYTYNHPEKPSQIPYFFDSLKVVGNNTQLNPPCYAKACINKNARTVGPDKQGTVNFPGDVMVRIGDSDPVNYKGLCGNISWNFSGDQGGGAGGTATQVANPAGVADSRTIAMQQVILTAQPLAKSLANILIPPPSFPKPSPISDWAKLKQDQLHNVGNDYIGIMLPYSRAVKVDESNEVTQALMRSKETGWIKAGEYYSILTGFIGGTTVGVDRFAGKSPTEPRDANFGIQYKYGDFNKMPFPVTDYTAKLKKLTDTRSDELKPTPGMNPIDEYILNDIEGSFGASGGGSIPYKVTEKNAVVASAFSTAGLAGIAGAGAAWGIGASAALPMLPVGVGIISMAAMLVDISNQIDSLADNRGDPIVAISKLGTRIMNWTEAIWLAGTIVVFGTTMFSAIGMCMSPTGLAVATTLIWFVPMMMAIILAMLVAGAIMAYYVPLLPFILFLFTAIGWFMAVIEAMIAAPLVALGIAHPEGHEIVGRAEPAIMLLTGVFMRPGLIVVGFISGIILSRVSLWLLNQGVSNALRNVSGDWMGLYVAVAVIIYVVLVMSVIERCFALIHEIPSKVLRWVGGQIESFGEAEAGQKARSMAEAGAGALRGGMEATTKGDKGSGSLEKDNGKIAFK